MVGGLEADIAALTQTLQSKRCFCFPVDISHIAHSPLLQQIVPEFIAALRQVDLQPPQLPYVSNVTGQVVTAAQATDVDFWCQHLIGTVKFSDGLDTLLAQTGGIAIEMGPGHDLSVLLRAKLTASSTVRAINLISNKNENSDSYQYYLNKLGQLWLYGGVPDWSEFYRGQRRLRIALPTYAFDQQPFAIPQHHQLTGSGQKAVVSGKTDLIDDWFYQPSWSCSPLDGSASRSPDESTVLLLLVDDFLIGESLADVLLTQGHRVIQVKRAAAFAQMSQSHFALDPAQADDYQALLAALPELSGIRMNICHCWSVDGPEQTPFQDIMTRGFYSVVNLAKVLATHRGIEHIQLLLVSDKLHEIAAEAVLCEQKAPLLALSMVLPQEHPHINCRCVDITLPGHGVKQQQQLTRQLLAELWHEARGEPVVAYRGRQRWVQGFEPRPQPAVALEQSRLKKHGVYLLTGGFGGIGQILACHLAKTYQAKLVLLTRSQLPVSCEKAALVNSLLALGSEVEVLSADVANEQQMRFGIEQAEQRFGALNGVVHAAGLVGRDYLSPVVDLTHAQCQSQFAAKIEGIKVLSHILSDKTLDFALCMSSISSVLGGLGHAAYIAGNLYMDHFVRRHNRHSGFDWISVNWDGWQTEQKHTAHNDVAVSQDEFAMTAAQGVAAFERVLAQQEMDVIVHSTGHLETRRAQWIKLEALEQLSDTVYPRPALATPFVPPKGRLQSTLCEIVQQRLGIEKIGIHDNFFELNVDSFIIVQIVNVIKQRLDTDMSVLTFYKYSTITELAAFMMQLGLED